MLEVRPDGADQLLGGSIAERNTARCLGGRHCAVYAIACTSAEPVGATDRQ